MKAVQLNFSAPASQQNDLVSPTHQITYLKVESILNRSLISPQVELDGLSYLTKVSKWVREVTKPRPLTFSLTKKVQKSEPVPSGFLSLNQSIFNKLTELRGEEVKKIEKIQEFQTFIKKLRSLGLSGQY